MEKTSKRKKEEETNIYVKLLFLNVFSFFYMSVRKLNFCLKCLLCIVVTNLRSFLCPAILPSLVNPLKVQTGMWAFEL